MKRPPKYSELEIFNIMLEKTILPQEISNNIYENELFHNRDLKWKVNYYLFKKKLRNQLLDNNLTKLINLIGYLNWLVVILMVGFSIYTKHYMLLWLVVLYPFFNGSGLLDFDIILGTIVVVAVMVFGFNFHNFNFLFIYVVFVLAYLINKMQVKIFEKGIFYKAFADFETFWKYYSNKFIYIDQNAFNKNYKKIFEKYPELIV